MTALDPDAMLGTLGLQGVRVAVLGYDADARDHALALRRAGNGVAIGLEPGSPAWSRAEADGLPVDQPGAVVAAAEIVVVRTHGDQAAWRRGEPRVAAGALVVFASARALHTGQCARGGMDVVLVTAVDEPGLGCRIAVHRDVTRRALLRAVAYARTSYPAGVAMRSTFVANEAELERASARDRASSLLALTAQTPSLAPRVEPAPAPDEVEAARWFHEMLNRRGAP